MNEINYNNVEELGEFVEVAYASDQDVSLYYLQLYNGVTGSVDGSPLFVGVDGIAGEQGVNGGLSFTYFDLPGLSNSTDVEVRDGIAIVDSVSGRVVEFISYDGSFVATDGPAVGMLSLDIGVSKRGNENAAASLQLAGTGCVRSEFAWEYPLESSKGRVNTNQADICSTLTP